MVHLPEIVVSIIINNLTTNHDRNSASLVNKLWYTVDRYSRHTVYISNCYAISPITAINRFPNLRSLTLKVKHGITYPRIDSDDRVGSFDPWMEILSNSCQLLEQIRLKRMKVSDQNLGSIAIRFQNFKSLILSSCFGFTISGLSAIASNCSKLEQFEVEGCDVTDNTGRWLNSFPENFNSLISLNISCIKGVMNAADLVRLVARCSNLRTLSLSKSVSVNTVTKILIKSPQIVHLGIGSTIHNLGLDVLLPYSLLSLALIKCQLIQSLTFFYPIPTKILHVMYRICPNLVYVNMRFCTVTQGKEQVNFIKKCTNLRHLSVRGCIGDEGVEIVSNSCKHLEEFRVYRETTGNGVTEVGLNAISTGCKKLKFLTYFCSRMTNAALMTFANKLPNATCFKLIMSTPNEPDHTTLQPFDHGYGAIVQSCKELKKLTLSGLLTNNVFIYIGMYGERLQVVTVLNGGESDEGLEYVYNGCKNLRKMEIN
ncbi:transport inhibitor response 1-like protein Os04g0395600 isoform X2 [Rutidosis leptorrhynchoides]|uniref:transport inhibitor response 1-like protein Os04g0395600 isoform X2 n=1 Tax=Rutidosis leptorrhynchoides TaxID=125765 RepID=UPI003A9A04CB